MIPHSGHSDNINGFPLPFQTDRNTSSMVFTVKILNLE